MLGLGLVLVHHYTLWYTKIGFEDVTSQDVTFRAEGLGPNKLHGIQMYARTE